MRVGKKHEDFEFVTNNLIVNRPVHCLVKNGKKIPFKKDKKLKISDLKDEN